MLVPDPGFPDSTVSSQCSYLPATWSVMPWYSSPIVISRLLPANSFPNCLNNNCLNFFFSKKVSTCSLVNRAMIRKQLLDFPGKSTLTGYPAANGQSGKKKKKTSNSIQAAAGCVRNTHSHTSVTAFNENKRPLI